MDKLLYGDFEEQYTDYETAEIAILPVPYDGTSTWLKGADKGPRAILEASPNMEFYDIETDSEVYKHGIATLEPVTADSSPQAMAQEVEQRVEAILKDKIEEKHNIDPDRIFYAHEIKESDDSTWMYEVSQKLHDNVYVTIDLDVFDPAYMPSTGTPEPDGLTYRTVLTLLKLINERHNIVGLDVVELCPNDINKAPDFLASKLIYQILSIRFKQ